MHEGQVTADRRDKPTQGTENPCTFHVYWLTFVNSPPDRGFIIDQVKARFAKQQKQEKSDIALVLDPPNHVAKHRKHLLRLPR